MAANRNHNEAKGQNRRIGLEEPEWEAPAMPQRGELDVPAGFEPFDPSPFFASIGSVWIRRNVPPTFGMRIEERNTNSMGTAHGAALVALADLVLGRGIRAAVGGDLQIVAASLTADSAGPVRTGERIEGQADIQRRSGRTVFANCYLIRNEDRVVRVSGIYTVVDSVL
jgi:acyl-coenzyme A thioesterase 13